MKKPIRFINTLIAKGKARDAEFWNALKTDTRFKFIVSASIAFVSASAITSVHLFRNLMPHYSALGPTLLGTLLAGIIAILVLYGLVFPKLRNLRKPKMANEPMDRIPMPAALLSHILLAQAVCQKQVGIRHRGRWAAKYHCSHHALFA